MTLEVRIEKRPGRSFHLGVDFSHNGGVLGMLGPSGCGKSMTLKCIAGIETPDRGRIVLNGRVLYDSDAGINLRPQQRRVGYLFQNYALFPRMTVAENIAIGVHGDDRTKRDAVARWLDRLHLSGLERRMPDQLSGGQQQRVALARMLAAEPEIVLMDEPFSALDAHLREEMQLLVLETVRDCGDVIIVSHSRDEIFKLSDSCLVLSDGSILGRGETRELFRRPGKLQVAKLTGCKNFSRAERMGGKRVRAIDWGLDLETESEPGVAINHVGIRAHDFTVVPDDEPDAPNQVRVAVRERSEDPFEWTVLFGSPAAPDDGESRLWWKYSKYMGINAIPKRLRLPPEALLLLED
ncbi:MAG: ATP-binding cassette domain-containing protein [Planctomycetaceae bacterium]|nr:ATP-binding cassette domain-containing protein [Planctomycetaceae bacterium]